MGEQGPPDPPESDETKRDGGQPETAGRGVPPQRPDLSREPPDEDDADDRSDDAPKFELPVIGVPVDLTD